MNSCHPIPSSQDVSHPLVLRPHAADTPPIRHLGPTVVVSQAFVQVTVTL